jgi:hypothetical protein
MTVISVLLVESCGEIAKQAVFEGFQRRQIIGDSKLLNSAKETAFVFQNTTFEFPSFTSSGGSLDTAT